MKRAPQEVYQTSKGARHLLVRETTLAGGNGTTVCVDGPVLSSFERRCKYSFLSVGVMTGRILNT